ncbi:DNA-binding transcriptional regulator, MocR family, contains an aminotransferase domain [Duganella sacchari]|uniref:DNA-binding transcriptional regulator, MocR family, contains an aminotransferase domain n=1 Tax=Duganella sacchari TaxID=551987 RepID=A0A1M7R6I6_9BURK|nr:DNA-binding transcriptional regulator, MocR family, contains an aminotransferase domain [Duganella sacchari]
MFVLSAARLHPYTRQKIAHERETVKLYETLAAYIASQIAQGVIREGEKIPSVRQTSQHHNLSVSTVIRAFLLLESQGLIESRPQSGYFVRRKPAMQAAGAAGEPLAPAELARGATLDTSEFVLTTLRSINQGSVPLGSPYPDPAVFPWARLNQYANSLARRVGQMGMTADLPPGNPELIRQIARRHLENGLPVDASEIIVTTGATEALNLCLQAVAPPGSVIAVESPTYYALIQAIERMGMQVLEIDTDPVQGIDLAALERAIVENGVAACMVMPNFQNPLGFQMSDERKRAMVALLARHDVPVIENDVYHELYYGDVHPTSLKNYDTQGLVLHCNSFSKTLSPANRIGWALPGRYRAQVEKLKFLNTLNTPALPQLAIAEYLQNDGYDYHLRKVRKAYAQQASIMASAVRRFFPAGTSVSTPAGGYVLWVNLPDGVRALELYARAQERGISVGAGNIFATGDAFQHCIRLNYSYRWTPEVEAAVRTLGLLAGELVGHPAGST